MIYNENAFAYNIRIRIRHLSSSAAAAAAVMTSITMELSFLDLALNVTAPLQLRLIWKIFQFPVSSADNFSFLLIHSFIREPDGQLEQGYTCQISTGPAGSAVSGQAFFRRPALDL